MAKVTLDPQKMAHSAQRLQHTLSMLQETTQQLPAGMPMVMPPRVVTHTQMEVGQTMVHAMQDGVRDGLLAAKLMTGSAGIQIADGSFDIGGSMLAMYGATSAAIQQSVGKMSTFGKVLKIAGMKTAGNAVLKVTGKLGGMLGVLGTVNVLAQVTSSKQPWYWKVFDAAGQGAASVSPTNPVGFIVAQGLGGGVWLMESGLAGLVGDTAKTKELDKAVLDGKYGLIPQGTTVGGHLIGSSIVDVIKGDTATSDALIHQMGRGEHGGALGKVVAFGYHGAESALASNPITLGISATVDVASGGHTHYVEASLSYARDQDSAATGILNNSKDQISHFLFNEALDVLSTD